MTLDFETIEAALKSVSRHPWTILNWVEHNSERGTIRSGLYNRETKAELEVRVVYSEDEPAELVIIRLCNEATRVQNDA